MNRDKIAKEEMTRDPIFLLQLGRFIPSDRFEWDADKELFFDASEDCWFDDDALIDMGAGQLEWITQSVWLSREEAEDYGNRKSYDFGEKGKDWRVWCVPADGRLADFLKGVTDETLYAVQRH